MAYLGLAIQLLLSPFFGHDNDCALFMASGYLIAHGGSPYAPADLSSVFGNLAFRGTTSVGYPPPWPLYCSIAYRLSTAVSPSLFLYNFLLKLPLVAANLGLALAVRGAASALGADEKTASREGRALLLNPLLILATAAWGQIDGLVALLALGSLAALSAKRPLLSALALGLAFSIKPIVLPLIPLALIASRRMSLSTSLRFLGIFSASVVFFCALPFFAFGWGLGPILRGWNAHFSMAGGLSILSPFELLGEGEVLTGSLTIVGFLWFPALALACVLMKGPELELESLLRGALGLSLVFFLCRSWLSEPNIILVLALAAVLVASGKLGKGALLAIWTIPLAFSLFNLSLPKLLFLVFPSIETELGALDARAHIARIILRSLLVIPWQILGWKLVFSCLGRDRGSGLHFAGVGEDAT